MPVWALLSAVAADYFEQCDAGKTAVVYEHQNELGCPSKAEAREGSWCGEWNAGQSCAYDCYTACENCESPVKTCDKNLVCECEAHSTWRERLPVSCIWVSPFPKSIRDCGRPVSQRCILPGIGKFTVPLGWKGIDITCQMKEVRCTAGSRVRTTRRIRRKKRCEHSCFISDSFRDVNGFSCRLWNPKQCSHIVGQWGIYVYSEKDALAIKENCPGTCSAHCGIVTTYEKMRTIEMFTFR